MTLQEFEAAQDAREAELNIHLTALEKAAEELALTMDKVYSNLGLTKPTKTQKEED